MYSQSLPKLNGVVLNDSRSILSATAQAGLITEIQFWSTPPGYLRFSVPSFLLGILYERTMERLFPALRSRIVVIAIKKSSPQAPSTPPSCGAVESEPESAVELGAERSGSAWQSPMRFARRIGGKRSETLELQGFWRNCLPKPVIHL